jgi:hypothetical protein
VTEYAYTQNDNEIKLQLLEDGVAEDRSAATKIEVELFTLEDDPINRIEPAAAFDSTADPTLFDITDLVNANLTFKPDSTAMSGLSASKYYGRVLLYSTDYPNGIVWGKSHDDLFEFIASR